MTILVKNKLRVVHLPQVPCEGFVVEVLSEREAYLIAEALANQHCFLFDNNFIPDYSNVINVEMWDEDLDGEDKWTDYWNEEEMAEWDDFCENNEEYITTGVIK